MAASTVNLPERLRPWHASGLLFVFADAFEQQSATVNDAYCLDQNTQQQVANDNADRPVARPGTLPDRQQDKHTAMTRPQAAPAAPSSPSAFDADPATWPEPWRGYWQAARIAPPKRFCLTYPELSLDLSGHADPARREGMRRLMGDLPALRGHTAFWPHTDHNSLRPDAEAFYQGVRRIGADTVLLLADTALPLAQVPTDSPAEPPPCPSSQPVLAFRDQGLDWFLLPPIHAMLRETSLFQAVLQRLATLLPA